MNHHCAVKRCNSEPKVYLYFRLEKENTNGRSLYGILCSKHAEEKLSYYTNLGRNTELLDIGKLD